MKVEPKDTQKVVLLVGAIVVAFGIAIWRVMGFFAQDAKEQAARAAPSPTTTQVFRASPGGESSEALVARIERWSQAPAAPASSNPFREVLQTGFSRGPVPATISRTTTGVVPFMPGATFGGGASSVNFPEVKVHGVLVDPQPNESFAAISVGGKMVYAHTGAEIAEGLTVKEITQSGIWLAAGKERAFIEVNRAYRPSGTG